VHDFGEVGAGGEWQVEGDPLDVGGSALEELRLDRPSVYKALPSP